jgi:hypothetical protein
MRTDLRPEHEVSTDLLERWQAVAHKLEELARALPAELYDSRPHPAVRTPAEVLRHVAFWNQYVADTLRGAAASDGNELPADRYPDKARIVDALRQSGREAGEALRDRDGALAGDSLRQVVPFLEHTSEHYGQLVVYARLAGIVPPASRP